LQGLTGQLDMWWNRTAFRRNFPELLDELAPQCVVVFVDAWTSLGGSQFIDSPGTGRYGSYLCDEVVAFVDERYRTLGSPQRRRGQARRAVPRPRRGGVSARARRDRRHRRLLRALRRGPREHRVPLPAVGAVPRGAPRTVAFRGLSPQT